MNGDYLCRLSALIGRWLSKSYHGALRILGLSSLYRRRVFANKYHNNGWKGRISLSGRGSDPENTSALCSSLPTLISQLSIRSVIDAPCGDFNWQGDFVQSSKVNYLGMDIVPELVHQNSLLHQNSRVKFIVHDICNDIIPFAADAILCRDCLVHLSYDEIFMALRKFSTSGSRFLLATTFTSPSIVNKDIVTGSWRPLNMCLAPFFFPAPISVLPDFHGDDPHSSKSIAAWRLDQLYL